MNFFTKREVFPIVLILIIFAVGILVYPSLPEVIPTHWNLQGEIDGQMQKSIAILIVPAIILAAYLLMTFLPYLDPLRENYAQFWKVYFAIRIGIIVFLGAIYLYILLAPLLNLALPVVYFLIPLSSLLLITLGLTLPWVKRNYFVGIRTPWTLYSDMIWEKTHKRAGKVFLFGGIITLLTLFVPSFAFWIFFPVIIAITLYSIIYSYLLFRKFSRIQ